MDTEEMENMATVSRNYDIIHLLIKKGNFDLPHIKARPKTCEEKVGNIPPCIDETVMIQF